MYLTLKPFCILKTSQGYLGFQVLRSSATYPSDVLTMTYFPCSDTLASGVLLTLERLPLPGLANS